MALKQPPLSEKVVYFAQLERLREQGDSEDDGDAGMREEQDRRARTRFFNKDERSGLTSRVPRPGKDSISISVAVAVAVAGLADAQGKEVAGRAAASDGPGAPTHTVQATQPQPRVTRARAHRLLLDPAADETAVPDTARAKEPQRQALRTSCAAAESPSVSTAKTRKRKREHPVKVRPEHEQVFQGLSLYYIPNNDIAPARRLRINKSREYGAAWSTDPRTATHVIVDKGLHYEHVEKAIGSHHGAKVVNEDYPIDCIRFRSILDHTQKKYRIPGQPREELDGNDAAAGDEVPSGSNEPETSLQLKPRPGDQHRPDPARLSRSLEPSDASAVGGAPPHPDSKLASPREEETAPSSKPPDASKDGAADAGADAGATPQGNVPHEHKHGGNDELSSLIAMVQEYRHLPLDKDEEEDESRSTANQAQHPSASEGSEECGPSEDEGEGEGEHLKTDKMRLRSASRRKQLRFEDRFGCHSAGAQHASLDNPNSRTIEVLQSMASYYSRVGDQWRTIGYRKAIATLKRQSVKIATEEAAYELPHVGRRIAKKIEEIATTDRLRRLEHAQAEPTDRALQLFLGIYGVGAKQAQRWISQGHRTLEDLRAGARLSASQQIGIDHYDDLNTRIPRAEVEALGAAVKRAAARIDARVEVIIGGSYRRGADSSHDVDVMVTRAGTDAAAQLRPFLAELVGALRSDGVVTARLASSRAAGDGSKWHGCCVLPQTQTQTQTQTRTRTRGVDDRGGCRPVWRRIDFLLVPETEMGGALIYFTGNDVFNRSLRLLASKKGMRLNQRGLYRDVMRGAERENLHAGELVEGRDERRIFEILGVAWREPHERWC